MALAEQVAPVVVEMVLEVPVALELLVKVVMVVPVLLVVHTLTLVVVEAVAQVVLVETVLPTFLVALVAPALHLQLPALLLLTQGVAVAGPGTTMVVTLQRVLLVELAVAVAVLAYWVLLVETEPQT
jgi:hypothetical protein